MALKQENLHDVRMIRRHIGREKITRADWEKVLADLPDLAALAETSEIVFERTPAEADAKG